MNCIRINIKIISYKLFMKPPPQLLKTYVIILQIFDIVYVLRYNFSNYNNKNTQKDVTLCDYKLHIDPNL